MRMPIAAAAAFAALILPAAFADEGAPSRTNGAANAPAAKAPARPGEVARLKDAAMAEAKVARVKDAKADVRAGHEADFEARYASRVERLERLKALAMEMQDTKRMHQIERLQERLRVMHAAAEEERADRAEMRGEMRDMRQEQRESARDVRQDHRENARDMRQENRETAQDARQGFRAERQEMRQGVREARQEDRRPEAALKREVGARRPAVTPRTAPGTPAAGPAKAKAATGARSSASPVSRDNAEAEFARLQREIDEELEAAGG
jgi:hypothetical protein